MSGFQDNKSLIRRYYADLDEASDDAINGVLQEYTSKDYLWRGMHPFYEQRGSDTVAETFWKPLRRAFAPVQRRQDVFMAGSSVASGEERTEWVCSMGHLMGLFDAAWLGIPPTGKMVFLRYVEFNRVAAGRIRETALFCDIISVLQQAGQCVLPQQTGAAVITPGPRTHDGLLFDAQEPDESRKTLELIERMIADLTAAGLHSSQDELASTWHDDMIWWGPAGIGATYTRARYEEQHQGPFDEGLDDIEYHGHVCRFAEGRYGGFFGWPNLTMTPSGGFMGLPASNKRAEMRVVDIYRRESEKLAENWIFIDMLHFLSTQGIDVLGRMRRLNKRG